MIKGNATKVLLPGGLAALATEHAPANSGYLVDRWPLMVVPHHADISPNAWPDDEATGGLISAPYLRANWNGISLEYFFQSDDSELHQWGEEDTARLIRACFGILLTPYYTLVDARKVASAHRVGADPTAAQASSEVLPQKVLWGNVVKVEHLDMSCFKIIRSPLEDGSIYIPKLSASKVLRHPEDNSPILLDPRSDVLDPLNPLIRGIFRQDMGTSRFIWPALIRWRPLADRLGGGSQAEDERDMSLPVDVAEACAVAGVRRDLGAALLNFLRSFKGLKGVLDKIYRVGPEFLAAEIIQSAFGGAKGAAEVPGIERIRPFVWRAVETLDGDRAVAQRKNLWLFDHDGVVALFLAGGRGGTSNEGKWANRISNHIRDEARKTARGAPCWVCFKVDDAMRQELKNNNLRVDTTDPAAFEAGGLLFGILYATCRHMKPEAFIKVVPARTSL